MAKFEKMMSAAARYFIKAGIFAGKKIADGYRKIDPDVMRHVLQIPLLSYTLFLSRQEKIDPGKPDGHPPLIFVHGMGGKRGDFLPMSLYLRLMGRTRSYRINFDAGQSIEEMAEALANFIRDVINATGEKHVEIVAHSLGGIVSRLSINEHAIDSHVKTLITLGTPHKGTYPARYANTANIRDIRPDSVLIRRLNGKSLPGTIRTVTFWSKNDLFVLPAESAALEGSEQIDASPFTHYSYLIDPESWIKVGRILAQ